MTNRNGLSLIELVISMGSATVLLAGLTACIIISTSALNPSGNAIRQIDAAAVQQQISSDIQQALRFTERTSTTATFTVPDRDGDGFVETVRYAWSGIAGDPLTYEINGGGTNTLIEDVQTFGMDYETRFIAGKIIVPSAPVFANFGFETAFANAVSSIQDRQYAVKVSLSEDGTLKSLSAYIDPNNQEYRLAIYSDASGEPNTLLAESSVDIADGLEWHTLAVADTPLTAGDYWLAISFADQLSVGHYEGGSGDTRWYARDAVTNGFDPSWNTGGDANFSVALSLYATYEPN